MKLSIIIATFNSEKFLPRVINSIKRQSFPKDEMEIIFVDGGSVDNTLEIAKNNKIIVVNNPRTEPVYGKYLGYLKAKSKYIMYLDHDEVLNSKYSIEKKVKTLESCVKIKSIAGGNYINPKGYPFINNYINEFGDPFSFFIYRLSKRKEYFDATMRKKYPIIIEDGISTTYDLSNCKEIPIIELVAGGSMFDADYLKKNYKETLSDYRLIPHVYYLMYARNPYITIMKKDGIFHYSSESLSKYLKKINWRIKNNIYHKDTLGRSGYSGRKSELKNTSYYKQYLYIPYGLTLLFPIIDGIKLSVSRSDIRYMYHVMLTIYTCLAIIFHRINYSFGYKSTLKNYDDSVDVANHD